MFMMLCRMKQRIVEIDYKELFITLLAVCFVIATILLLGFLIIQLIIETIEAIGRFLGLS